MNILSFLIGNSNIIIVSTIIIMWIIVDGISIILSDALTSKILKQNSLTPWWLFREKLWRGSCLSCVIIEIHNLSAL